VLEWRQLAKLKSTYADALVGQIDRQTGRVHTSFSMAATSTGRLSSTDPNLQNIPVRTEEGRKVRSAFIPQKGWVMLAADYSQIELRLLAHFSGSKGLTQAFTEGLDIHTYTAALVSGKNIADVTKTERRAAKFVNFGLVYGMGARSLAKQIGGISITEAQSWIDAYFTRYEGVREYMDSNKEFARQHGYVQTLLGRKVWLPDIQSSHGGLRSNAERAAINAPLQGSNADIIKRAMPLIATELAGNFQAKILMQVHDELVFEAPPEEVDALKQLLPPLMTGVVKLNVPLAVEVGSGPTWEEAH
jgi:DNA polymerase-1